MPDYNKGDFTQQGIDGFVEGGLHLNEKRCLTAKISTDEDSAGLDSVEINVHDHLNDLDYTFTGENVIAGNSVIGQAKTIKSRTFTANDTYHASDYDCDGFDPVYVAVDGVTVQTKEMVLAPLQTVQGENFDGEYFANVTTDYIAFQSSGGGLGATVSGTFDGVPFNTSSTFDGAYCRFSVLDSFNMTLDVQTMSWEMQLYDSNEHTFSAKFTTRGYPFKLIVADGTNAQLKFTDLDNKTTYISAFNNTGSNQIFYLTPRFDNAECVVETFVFERPK